MTLEDMMLHCEKHGCYWTLSCESMVYAEYLCKIFSFRDLALVADESGRSPLEAFSNAVERAKIHKTCPFG